MLWNSARTVGDGQSGGTSDSESLAIGGEGGWLWAVGSELGHNFVISSSFVVAVGRSQGGGRQFSSWSLGRRRFSGCCIAWWFC